jgi:hypothetical protein
MPAVAAVVLLRAQGFPAADAVLTNVEQITGADNRQQIRAVLVETSAMMKHADDLVVAAKPLVVVARLSTATRTAVDALVASIASRLAGRPDDQPATRSSTGARRWRAGQACGV